MSTTQTIDSNTFISSFSVRAGKQNLMASFNKFLVSQIGNGEVHNGVATTLPSGKTFWWFFGYPLSTLLFPSISVAEVGLFTPGETAIGRVLSHDPTTGQPIKGTRNQSLIEINAWAKDTTALANAEKVVRDLRDSVMYVLMNASDVDEDTGRFIVPPIQLRDYSQGVPSLVGVISLDKNPNSITERFIVDPVDPNIKRYRLLVRVYWYELT